MILWATTMPPPNPRLPRWGSGMNLILVLIVVYLLLIWGQTLNDPGASTHPRKEWISNAK